MTKEPALCCVATLLHHYVILLTGKLQRQAMLNDVTQGEARIDFSSISTSLVLHPTNHISPKKQVRVIRVLYRDKKYLGTNHCTCKRPTFVSLPMASWLQKLQSTLKHL